MTIYNYLLVYLQFFNQIKIKIKLFPDNGAKNLLVFYFTLDLTYRLSVTQSRCSN